MKFIPPLVHSHYSLGFGTASVEELVEWGARRALPGLALSDIETMAGQMRFHDACAGSGIKPITGVELRAGFSRQSVGQIRGRLVLLARDQRGYANLCRIVSRRRKASTSGDPVEELGEEADGLLVLTDEVSTLSRLLSAGVDRHAVRLLASAESGGLDETVNGVPKVAGLDIVSLNETDATLHTLLLAIRHGLTVSQVQQAGLDANSGRTADTDTGSVLAYIGGTAGEANRIEAAFTLDLTSPRRVPPLLPELNSGSVASELRSRCEAGLARVEQAGRRTEYETRLEHELQTIERLGFSDYFLAVAEIVRGARESGVATAGRGSAAGSLVAFVLGITEVDPVDADLLFERFLHEQREAPPDIDLDVASTGRDALNAWVVRRFGRERVAGVASYSTYRARSAVRAGLAALGLGRTKVEATLRRLDLKEASGEEEAEHVEELLGRSVVPAVRRAAPLIRRLVGMPSHLSAHPGGIVIGNRSLAELVPLERAPGGMIVTQYDYRSVERAGFLKIDLLGNHFLSEMQETLARLPGGTTVPADDDRTWQMLDRADTIGCFQVESPAVRSVLRRLPIRRFSDLVAALAVVRPGAAAGASKERYVLRARGEEEYRALEILGEGTDGERYAALEQRLERTHGVLLYEEDIIRLLATVGGISYASADALRSSIIAAGESKEDLVRLGEEFVSGAVVSGSTEDVSRRAWRAAARFASYSFAEAHAASYAALAWQAVWLRTHAPLEFACALVNHHRGLYPLRTTAAAVERWGVDLLPPSVNSSELPSTVVRRPTPVVRIGLSAVKGLSRRTSADILRGRPYGDLGQLIERARPGRRELRGLLLAGACDELPPLSAAGYPLVHQVVLDGLAGEASPDALENVLRRIEQQPATGEQAEEFSRYQRLVRVRNELEMLNMHLTDHPMRLLRRDAERLGCVPASELGSRPDRRVRFAGLLAASRRVPTRDGELRYLTWEDETGLVEGVIFPKANERLAQRLTTAGPYLVEGMVRDTDGVPQFVVTECMPFHER